MFTRNVPARPEDERTPRKRSLLSFCTAIVAAAALAVLPAIPVMAAEGDSIETLTANAAAARTAADESAAASATAQADSDAAAALAAAAAAAAVTAAAASAEAAATAAAADPADPALDALAADALAALGVADADAGNTAAAATLAAAAAEAAAANAVVAADLATAADAELAAALAAEGPAEETDQSAKLIQSSITENGDECDNEPKDITTQNGNDNCEPEIRIVVTNICPTEIEVTIKYWVEGYSVYAGGVQREVKVVDGTASFTVTDFTGTPFKVTVLDGGSGILASESVKIKGVCPEISVKIRECQTLDGDSKVGVYVDKLSSSREYDIVIEGPNGFWEKFEVSDEKSWETSYDNLAPGTYTVTVTSDHGRGPDVGPVVYEFTVAPCPEVVVITITPVCAAGASGSLGATLSNLVVGREYRVTVTGPSGTVTDVTFTADSSSWAVPPASLPPGTYTVTVVDTESYEWVIWFKNGGGDEIVRPPREPLTWSATGTITSCPPLPTLARTGGEPSGALLPGLLLVPFGAALLLAGGARRRKLFADKES